MRRQSRREISYLHVVLVGLFACIAVELLAFAEVPQSIVALASSFLLPVERGSIMPALCPPACPRGLRRTRCPC